MRKLLLVMVVVLSLSGCGYNTLQSTDEQIKSAWSEVLNQYQRRADLVPNLVATVKGEASFEQATLTQVIEARARATAIQVSPETLDNPEAFQKFQSVQGALGGALSRLLAVSEQYPNLKANPAFRDLSNDLQLGGSITHISIDRNAAARFGLTATDVDEALYDAFGQRQVNEFQTETNQYNVILEVDAQQRGKAESLNYFYLRSPLTGEMVPLSAVAKVDAPVTTPSATPQTMLATARPPASHLRKTNPTGFAES